MSFGYLYSCTQDIGGCRIKIRYSQIFKQSVLQSSLNGQRYNDFVSMQSTYQLPFGQDWIVDIFKHEN
jgi:hypothetical protein